MPFYTAGPIKYFRFDSLEYQAVYHAVFTRLGGISSPPWQSLNFGASVGDMPERVKHNRETALTSMNILPASVYDVYQIHSTDIVYADKPLPVHDPHLKADAIVTDRSNVTLLMRFADCVPILLYDPIDQAIGIIHAGWVGTVDKIVQKTIFYMHEKFGSKPGNLIAGIGPAIGQDHYSVGKDVVGKVMKAFGHKADDLLNSYNGIIHLDLWKANRTILEESGVEKVETAAICTQCNMNDWYSHRGEHGKTGRFGAIIGIRS